MSGTGGVSRTSRAFSARRRGVAAQFDDASAHRLAHGDVPLGQQQKQIVVGGTGVDHGGVHEQSRPLAGDHPRQPSQVIRMPVGEKHQVQRRRGS